jgi:hypothetical protein
VFLSLRSALSAAEFLLSVQMAVYKSQIPGRGELTDGR